MTWYMPTEEKCPVCGKTLFKKRANQLICLNEQCSTYVKEEPRTRKAKAEDGTEKKAAKKTTKKTTAKKTAAKKTTAQKASSKAKTSADKKSKAKAEEEA